MHLAAVEVRRKQEMRFLVGACVQRASLLIVPKELRFGPIMQRYAPLDWLQRSCAHLGRFAASWSLS